MAVNPKSLENLKKEPPQAHMTPEQRKEKARKAGKASAKARKEKKEASERICEILALGLLNGKTNENIKSIEDAQGKNLNVMDAMILKQMQKALKGDTRAFETLMQYAGMKPAEKKEIKADLKTDILEDIMSQLGAEDEDEKE